MTVLLVGHQAGLLSPVRDFQADEFKNRVPDIPIHRGGWVMVETILHNGRITTLSAFIAAALLPVLLAPSIDAVQYLLLCTARGGN